MTEGREKISPVRVAEILGPPGAGKTTVLEAAVCRAPQLRPVQAFRAPRHAAAYVGAALAVAPVLRSAMRGADGALGTARGNQPPASSRARRPFNWMVRLQAAPRILHAERSRGDVVVFDQGPVYTLARLHDPQAEPMDRFTRWWHSSLQTWARLLDVVLLLDAPDDLLLERIRRRSKSHAFKEMAPDAAAAALREYRARCERVAHRLAEVGSTRLVRLDTGVLDPERLRAAVLAELMPLHTGTTPEWPAR